MNVYLPFMGVAFYFIFALLATAVMGKFGVSDWAILAVFLIGQSFFAGAVLLKLFVNKIVLPRAVTI
jgi:hypothetical protein